MLVLSRRNDESIVIGDDIVITVVDVRGDKVRLGIEAPKNVTVHRREIWDAIRAELNADGQSENRKEGNASDAHATEPTAEAKPEAGDDPPPKALREGQG